MEINLRAAAIPEKDWADLAKRMVAGSWIREMTGRGNKGGIAEYARNMGRADQTMNDWVCAARVAQKLPDQSGGLVELLNYTTCLSIIHRCPEEDWVCAAQVAKSTD